MFNLAKSCSICPYSAGKARCKIRHPMAQGGTPWHQMQRDSTLFRIAEQIPNHQCCIPLHRSPHPALLQNGPPNGLMQAHRERHKPTSRKEVHCLNNTIRYPNMGTVKRAAEIYGLSPSYIRRLCKTGKIRYVNAGHMWLVNLDSLARYFEQGDPVPAEPGQTAHGIRQIG